MSYMRCLCSPSLKSPILRPFRSHSPRIAGYSERLVVRGGPSRPRCGPAPPPLCLTPGTQARPPGGGPAAVRGASAWWLVAVPTGPPGRRRRVLRAGGVRSAPAWSAPARLPLPAIRPDRRRRLRETERSRPGANAQTRDRQRPRPRRRAVAPLVVSGQRG